MSDTKSAEAEQQQRPAPAGRSGLALQVLAGLNPVLLLVIGFVLNHSIDQAKVQIEENTARVNDLKTAAETSSIVARERVDKVKVISDFINDLTGTDERRRQLAIEAIFIALPDEATRLVKAVERSASTTNSNVTAVDVTAARDALDSTRARLTSNMFSQVKAVRVDALGTIERGWADDTRLIDMLLDRATQDVKARAAGGWQKPNDPQTTQQLASIYNTAEFLSFVRPPDDAKLRAKIRDFLGMIAQNSDDTRRIVGSIQANFR